MKERVIYYVRESVIQSIIADLVSFGFLTFLLILNYKVLNADWYVTFFILLLWLIFVSSKGSKKVKEFKTNSELANYLKSLEE